MDRGVVAEVVYIERGAQGGSNGRGGSARGGENERAVGAGRPAGGHATRTCPWMIEGSGYLSYIYDSGLAGLDWRVQITGTSSTTSQL